MHLTLADYTNGAFDNAASKAGFSAPAGAGAAFDGDALPRSARLRPPGADAPPSPSVATSNRECESGFFLLDVPGLLRRNDPLPLASFLSWKEDCSW